jgi:hypothetical protein
MSQKCVIQVIRSRLMRCHLVVETLFMILIKLMTLGLTKVSNTTTLAY